MKLVKDLGRKEYGTQGHKVRWGLYECPECFKHFETTTPSVKSGASTKCRSCASIPILETHGESKTKLYRVWQWMQSRCSNKRVKSFKNYGGRGITVCDGWKDSYETFRDWALSNGYKEGLSIDRKDNDGNYEPSNCRWTTQTIQSRNTRRIYTSNSSGYRGVGLKNNRWVAKIGVNSKTINLGSFAYPWTAGMAYDSYVVKNNLEHTMNFIKRKVA